MKVERKRNTLASLSSSCLFLTDISSIVNTRKYELSNYYCLQLLLHIGSVYAMFKAHEDWQQFGNTSLECAILDVLTVTLCQR